MFAVIAFIPSKLLPMPTGSARRPGTLTMECNSHHSLASAERSVPVAPPYSGRIVARSETIRKQDRRQERGSQSHRWSLPPHELVTELKRGRSMRHPTGTTCKEPVDEAHLINNKKAEGQTYQS